MAAPAASIHTTTHPVAPSSPYSESHSRIFPRASPNSKPQHSRRITLKILSWLSTISVFTGLILAILILVSGTSTAPSTYHKASHASILLQSFSILDIPIKYPFLCPGFPSNTTNTTSSPSPVQLQGCEPQWTVKFYLSAAWAYRDVQGDYTPIHLLWKEFGKPSNLTEALVVMDNTLQLLKLGGTFAERGYNIPTEPTLRVPIMTPIGTRAPSVLLIVGCVLIALLFGIWVWESCTSAERCSRTKKLRRDAVFLLVVASMLCDLGAAVHVHRAVSKSVNQLGNNEYLSGGNKLVVSGWRLQVLVGVVVALQGLAFICIGLGVWTEAALERAGMKEREVQQANEYAVGTGPETFPMATRQGGNQITQ